MAEARAALVDPGSAFEIAIEDVRGVRLPVFRHRLRSLREILEASARFPERPYVVEAGVRIDYGSHLGPGRRTCRGPAARLPGRGRPETTWCS